ncbi:MAG: universal stress protein [Halobacteriaceae archaeon]
MYRVLLPIDDDEDRARAQAEAVAALPSPEEVEAVVMHVFPGEEAAEKTAATQTQSGRTAESILRDAGVRVETESRWGDPAAAIVDAARERDADVIVLGGRKRSALGSALFGSVSQAVTLESDRPVTVTGSAGD